MGDDKDKDNDVKKEKKQKAPAAKNVEEQANQLIGGPLEERGCTDILCCIIFIAYMIFMVVLAVEGVATGEPYKLVAVWDSSWSPCGLDDLESKPYVYFAVPHPDHLNKTTCVKECPMYMDDAEKESKYGKGLDCNLKNNTQFADFGCAPVCDPFSVAESSSTKDQGWSNMESPTINYQALMCVYNTTVVGNRLCFPGAEVFSMVKGLTDAVSKSVNMDMITSAMNDVDKGMDIIYASFGIIFLLGIVYMIFVRLFSGVIVWICIILFFILLAILGIWVHEKSKAIDQAIKDNDGIETEGNTKDTRDTYLYVSYGILAIWCICIIGLLCMWNNIRLAIAIIKTATIFTIQTPTAMLIAPVMAIVTIIWWIIWIVFFVHVYAVGDVTKRSGSSIFGTVIHSEEQGYKVWAFIFGGLWGNALCQAITQFLLASTVSIWYFAQPDGTAHAPVLRSLYRAFRYHMGSLAFGAFILAIVQTIRLMLEYVAKQMEATGAEKNKCTKYILNCLRCCMACFERFIKFLNKNAYIQIALSGENFCTSAKQGMKMVWNNANRVALVSGLGAAFIFVGQVFMITANVSICYYIYTNAEPYKTTMGSTFLPLLIIFFISLGISMCFMSVYGMAIDTILMCFLYDEEMNKGNMEGKMRAPSTLKDFFADHDKKVEDAQKRKADKEAKDAKK